MLTYPEFLREVHKECSPNLPDFKCRNNTTLPVWGETDVLYQATSPTKWDQIIIQYMLDKTWKFNYRDLTGVGQTLSLAWEDHLTQVLKQKSHDKQNLSP